MKINYNNKNYSTIYTPYFLKEHFDEFSIYSMILPSGAVEDVICYRDEKTPLEDNLKMLLREYAFEDDEKLTEKSKELKQDVRKLFNLD